jgi:hypothetical protein
LAATAPLPPVCIGKGSTRDCVSRPLGHERAEQHLDQVNAWASTVSTVLMAYRATSAALSTVILRPCHAMISPRRSSAHWMMAIDD